MASTTAPAKKATRGRGRPSLQDGQETVVVPIRMTRGQREKLERLAGDAGAAQWVRDRIDRAREPGSES